MERLAGPVISLIISLIATALAWGRMVMRVERAEQDIKDIVTLYKKDDEQITGDCKYHRTQCHNDICRKMDSIFTKLDDIRDKASLNLTSISVQIARLEEKMDKK